MKKFRAEIDVMPLKALLDPQGKAVTGSMKNLGLPEIQNVRINRGKHQRQRPRVTRRRRQIDFRAAASDEPSHRLAS